LKGAALKRGFACPFPFAVQGSGFRVRCWMLDVGC
jgi:hypothetical protein